MLLERKKRHQVNHEGSWAVSYVDMLTLLLCFFIIFFNSKQITSEDESSVLKKVLTSMTRNSSTGSGFSESSTQCGGTGSVSGDGRCQVALNPSTETSGHSENSLTGNRAGVASSNHGGGGTSAGALSPGELMDSLAKAFSTLANAKVVIVNKALILDFDNVSFFRSGSTRITRDGQESISRILGAISPYRDDLRLTVQGHTDSNPIARSNPRFSDNWELSAIRSTAVLKQFVQAGYDPRYLSAEGYADTQIISGNKQDQSLDRRITFKIEVRQRP